MPRKAPYLFIRHDVPHDAGSISLYDSDMEHTILHLSNNQFQKYHRKFGIKDNDGLVIFIASGKRVSENRPA